MTARTPERLREGVRAPRAGSTPRPAFILNPQSVPAGSNPIDSGTGPSTQRQTSRPLLPEAAGRCGNQGGRCPHPVSGRYPQSTVGSLPRTPGTLEPARRPGTEMPSESALDSQETPRPFLSGVRILSSRELGPLSWRSRRHTERDRHVPLPPIGSDLLTKPVSSPSPTGHRAVHPESQVGDPRPRFPWGACGFPPLGGFPRWTGERPADKGVCADTSETAAHRAPKRLPLSEASAYKGPSEVMTHSVESFSRSHVRKESG